MHKQLRRQMRFLSTSCKKYDEGDRDEGIRIAGQLRILFHDTNKCTSLRAHLRLYNLKLLSTCENVPEGARFWTALTNIRIAPRDAYAHYIPKLDTARAKALVSFEQWWSQEIVYLLQESRLTRKHLVLSAANKDGGAHVDEKLDPAYEGVVTGAGWKMTLHELAGHIDIPFEHAHLAALRQMGFEVLYSPDLSRWLPRMD